MDEDERLHKLKRIAMLTYKYGIRYYGISDMEGERTTKAECVFCRHEAPSAGEITHHPYCIYPLAKEMDA